MRIHSESLMLRFPTFAGVIALALGVLSPQVARAQQQTFSACYVPDVGAIYMIKLTGLPANCLSATHVEISWSSAVGDGHSLDAADGDPVDALFVDSEGNVGIGTVDPTQELAVAGNIVTMRPGLGSRWMGQAGGFGLVGNAGFVGMEFERESDGSNRTHLWVHRKGVHNKRGVTIDADGKVGIGTDSPTELLTVAGTIESTSGGFKFPDGTTQATAFGWVEITNDTAPFDLNCEYRWETTEVGGAMMYPTTVFSNVMEMHFSSVGAVFVRSTDKSLSTGGGFANNGPARTYRRC